MKRVKRAVSKVKSRLSGNNRVRGPMIPKAGGGSPSRYKCGGKMKRK